jgi:hypothetical protein
MRNGSRAWVWTACLVLGALLIWGLEEIVVTPFEAGDVYPPYSSLRTDPLGSKALYESLAALPGIAVERLYKPRTTLQGTTAVIFVLGVDPGSWAGIEDQTLDEYEKLAGNGGRLVIAFLPVPPQPISSNAKQSRLEVRWGIKMAYREGVPVRGAIPRQTALYFDPSPQWATLSQRDAVERDFGKGSVVLVADSYFLSNEGLREARDTDLIARLVGPARHVVFDENHFGVAETGSVAKLMRKYRLEGAVLVLVVVAGLFLWRSASSFLPPRPTRSAQAVMGFDSFEGLAALLRRGIAEKDLLNTCFAEWRKSAPKGSRGLQIDGKGDPVAAYRAACRVLEKR